ncbi:MAG: GDP-mannose mannosyl hydrolase [Sedimentisphaerales bacterium]|nr:GDP-mannose mannosyl hydrolase [Sedimentisphaerales bacterium]
MEKQNPGYLSHQQLVEVVRLVPLISIDLVIENTKGEILVGMRENEPARGYWFVPGGRILKDERISEAFERIMKNELGLEVPYSQAEFIGVFEHLYPTNFTKQDGFGTHYVVLSHRIKLNNTPKINSDDQHGDMKWLSKDKILEDEKVHPNTKAYFEKS